MSKLGFLDKKTFANYFEKSTEENNIIKFGYSRFTKYILQKDISEFICDAFPDGLDKEMEGKSFEEQIAFYRVCSSDKSITFSKDTNGKITPNIPFEEIQKLWDKGKPISGESFEGFRMQHSLFTKNGVLIGFSGESEFSCGNIHVLLINDGLNYVWYTEDNNGAGYKSYTHYFSVSLIRDPASYKL